MKSFHIRAFIIIAVTVALIALTISFSREVYIVYITAVMGAILGLLAFQPLEGANKPTPLRFSYAAVFASGGFWAGKLIEAAMRQQSVLAMIFAGFIACHIVGFAIGKHYRPQIRRFFGLPTILTSSVILFHSIRGCLEQMSGVIVL